MYSKDAVTRKTVHDENGKDGMGGKLDKGSGGVHVAGLPQTQQ